MFRHRGRDDDLGRVSSPDVASFASLSGAVERVPSSSSFMCDRRQLWSSSGFVFSVPDRSHDDAFYLV